MSLVPPNIAVTYIFIYVDMYVCINIFFSQRKIILEQYSIIFINEDRPNTLSDYIKHFLMHEIS